MNRTKMTGKKKRWLKVVQLLDRHQLDSKKIYFVSINGEEAEKLVQSGKAKRINSSRIQWTEGTR